jgi:hypothetical protein
MKAKTLEMMFVVLVALIFLVLIAIIMIGEKEKFGGFKEITGTVQSYEVYHGAGNLRFINIRTTERYDDKFFEHLQHLQQRKDETFMRGKVFLRG